ETLLRYSWPGNIRELRNMIERAVLLCGEGSILPRHLPLEKMRVTFATSVPAIPAPPAPVRPAKAANRAVPTPPILPPAPRLTPDEERAQIEAALAACGGNQTRAAQMLGIGRRTLINRVQEFGLIRP